MHDPHGASRGVLCNVLASLLDLTEERLDVLLRTVRARATHAVQHSHHIKRCELSRPVNAPGASHKRLKRHEATTERPFSNLASHLRPEARRSYWVGVWGDVKHDKFISKRLQHFALNQAETLKRVSSKQIQRTLRHIKFKQGGGDGWSLSALISLPDEALSGFRWSKNWIGLKGSSTFI